MKVSELELLNHAGSPRPAVVAEGDDAIRVEAGDILGS